MNCRRSRWVPGVHLCDRRNDTGEDTDKDVMDEGMDHSQCLGYGELLRG